MDNRNFLPSGKGHGLHNNLLHHTREIIFTMRWVWWSRHTDCCLGVREEYLKWTHMKEWLNISKHKELDKNNSIYQYVITRSTKKVNWIGCSGTFQDLHVGAKRRQGTGSRRRNDCGRPSIDGRKVSVTNVYLYIESVHSFLCPVDNVASYECCPLSGLCERAWARYVWSQQQSRGGPPLLTRWLGLCGMLEAASGLGNEVRGPMMLCERVMTPTLQ